MDVLLLDAKSQRKELAELIIEVPVQDHLLVALPLCSSLRDVVQGDAAGMLAPEIVLEGLEIDPEALKAPDLCDVFVSGLLDLDAHALECAVTW